MRGLCYTLEDSHTVVVQPEGASSLLRLRLPDSVDVLARRAILRASPQKPVLVDFDPGAWDQDSGTFAGGALEEVVIPQ